MQKELMEIVCKYLDRFKEELKLDNQYLKARNGLRNSAVDEEDHCDKGQSIRDCAASPLTLKSLPINAKQLTV